MKLFKGHKYNISNLCQNNNGTMIATVDNNKDPNVIIWDATQEKLLKTFQCEVTNVNCLSFNSDSSLLVLFGVDDHSRTKAVVYDLAAVHQGRDPKLIAKQLTDYDVKYAKFSPIESNVLVSCGRENIRFYRIKKGHLPGKPVVLNHYARNSTFYSLDFECSFTSANVTTESSMKKVFVGNDKGLVFQINYKTSELESVFKCHNLPIYSIKCNPAYVCTGSEDGYLRVWPFDFSEFFIEAKHSGSVSNIDIQVDGLKIMACTKSGNLGVLDVTTYEYNTKLRGSSSKVYDISASTDENQSLVVTSISDDNLIKVYNEKNDLNTNTTFIDQISEFQCSEDKATCVVLSRDAR